MRQLTLKISLVGEKAHLLYKLNISCQYNQYETKSHNFIIALNPFHYRFLQNHAHKNGSHPQAPQ